MLDPGSQSHFITEELAQKLQLSLKRESFAVNGIMRNAMEIERATKIHIESRHSGFKVDLDCLVLPCITEKLPQIKIDKKKLLDTPEDYRLADPSFDKPGKIDLLIGASQFWNILCVGQIKKARGHPTWQKTQLGWIIEGEISPKVDTSTTSFSHLVTNQALDEQIERFTQRFGRKKR